MVCGVAGLALEPPLEALPVGALFPESLRLMFWLTPPPPHATNAVDRKTKIRIPPSFARQLIRFTVIAPARADDPGLSPQPCINQEVTDPLAGEIWHC